MTEPSYILLSGTAVKMQWQLQQRLDNEWFSGDEHDRIVDKIDRLERFKQYVELHKQFTPQREI